MRLLQQTAEQVSPDARLAASFAALEMPYPAGTADKLAVSWAVLEIQP